MGARGGAASAAGPAARLHEGESGLARGGFEEDVNVAGLEQEVVVREPEPLVLGLVALEPVAREEAVQLRPLHAARGHREHAEVALHRRRVAGVVVQHDVVPGTSELLNLRIRADASSAGG